jgi:hypothetical protein
LLTLRRYLNVQGQRGVVQVVQTLRLRLKVSFLQGELRAPAYAADDDELDDAFLFYSLEESENAKLQANATAPHIRTMQIRGWDPSTARLPGTYDMPPTCCR